MVWSSEDPSLPLRSGGFLQGLVFPYCKWVIASSGSVFCVGVLSSEPSYIGLASTVKKKKKKTQKQQKNKNTKNKNWNILNK